MISLFLPYMVRHTRLVEITIKMKTIVQKPLMIKASSQKFRQLKKLNFFKTKDINSLFLEEHYTVKMDIIRYYLLPNSTA